MTGPQIAAGQVRSLRAMRKKLLNMATQWDDVDQFNMSRLEELADQAERVATEMLPDEEGK
jgi:hypothetical protein